MHYVVAVSSQNTTYHPNLNLNDNMLLHRRKHLALVDYLNTKLADVLALKKA